MLGVIAEYYNLTIDSGATLRGGGGWCPQAQQATGAEQRRRKYFVTNEHKTELW